MNLSNNGYFIYFFIFYIKGISHFKKHDFSDRLQITGNKVSILLDKIILYYDK